MKPIRAFVGHSFTDDDKNVVNTFLKFFDQLSESHPDFSWEHAEAAEPKDLATKVSTLLADKNVFIGICTRKERVVQPARFKKTWLRGLWRVRDEDLVWKTSDWIIQEIGLAVGRNLDLVLLVEQGIRDPGGLQGDVEYIPFDRPSPEKSFGKILEMVTALSPKTAVTTVLAMDTRSTPSDESKETEAFRGDYWATPKPEWKRHEYEFALMHMVEKDDKDGEATISKTYLATSDGQQSGNKDSWEAWEEWVRLFIGRGGKLSKLKALAETQARNSKTWSYLARAYKHYQQYRESAEAFQIAAREAGNDTARQLRLLGQATAALAREDVAAALEIASQMKTLVEERGSGELELLGTLRRLAEISKEDEVTIAILERFVDVDPSDIDTRFVLGHKHSELGNTELSLFHYLRIPYRERKGGTWNNLGVAFDNLGLPVKAVAAYREAEEMGETLAMSNLAQKLIGAGLLLEAQKKCDAALAIKDYHRNIAANIERLKDIPEEEEKKEHEILEKAKPISDFYAAMGRAVARPQPREIAPRWEGPECILSFTFHWPLFTAIGSFDRPAIGILAALAEGIGAKPDTALGRVRVEYRGTIRGRTIEARITRNYESEATKASGLLASDSENKVLMVLSDDENELRVMEHAKGSSPRFYCLKRLATGA
jgi:tetratricopeptide (TPR) repeat protein